MDDYQYRRESIKRALRRTLDAIAEEEEELGEPERIGELTWFEMNAASLMLKLLAFSQEIAERMEETSNG